MNRAFRILAAAGFAVATATAAHAQVGEQPAYPAGAATTASMTAARTTGTDAASATGASAAAQAAPTAAATERMPARERMTMAARGWKSGSGDAQGRPVIPGI